MTGKIAPNMPNSTSCVVLLVNKEGQLIFNILAIFYVTQLNVYEVYLRQNRWLNP